MNVIDIMTKAISGKSIRGKITTQHTVWCACCNHWEYVGDASTDRKEAILLATSQGWNYLEGVGWLCPDCKKKRGGQRG